MRSFITILFSFLLGGCSKHVDPSLEKNPRYILAKLMSNHNENVLSDVALFLNNKSKYMKKHQENLEYHGYEDPFADEFDFTFVLVEALKLNNKATVVDWRATPMETLELINDISNNTLANCNLYETLKQNYQQSEFNISYFLETNTSEPSIFACANNIGLTLIAIDNGTDSWVLVLINSHLAKEVAHYAKQSDINLYLTDRLE